VSFWGRHPSEVEEAGRSAAGEHDKRVARGERNVRHGVPGLQRMAWWKQGLAWLAVIALVLWFTMACINILNAPDAEDQAPAPGGAAALDVE